MRAKYDFIADDLCILIVVGKFMIKFNLCHDSTRLVQPFTSNIRN